MTEHKRNESAISVTSERMASTATLSTQYLGTTFAETVVNEPEFNLWWIAMLVGAVAIIGVVLVLSTKKKAQPSSQDKI